jgi:hypothetical protein
MSMGDQSLAKPASSPPEDVTSNSLIYSKNVGGTTPQKYSLVQINEEGGGGSLDDEKTSFQERRKSNPMPSHQGQDTTLALARQRTSDFSKRYLRPGESAKGSNEMKQ